MAASLENARLEHARAERDRLERQITLANDVQKRLLPRDIRPPAGFDIAGEGRVCEALSGDYYDAIPLADEKIALVVGDVAGHGVAQALYTAETRALLHHLLRRDPDPATALRDVNELLERDMVLGEFMSMFVGILDAPSRTLVYASAGHNPPLLCRAGGGGVEELVRTGPLLAAMEGSEYRVSDPISLSAGDVLVLYTDGLFEARDAEDELYGEERLRDSLARHAARATGAKQVLDGLLADLDGFRGEGGTLEDDITCLVVRAT